MGNLTYGAGIICHSVDPGYLLINVPWLVGSLGTMVEDVVIFGQFRVYARKREERKSGGGEMAVV
jgi:solute carrier family 66 (lysosomal lysine-arginine transporter), member 1